MALFRDNVGNSSYNAAAVKLEKRLSHGLTFNASFTFSKLIDDASSVFSQTIFTGPVLNTTGAADAYNRHLEKDVSSGDIPARLRARLGLRHSPRCGRSPGGRSRDWSACRRATPWPSRRRPTTTRALALPCSGPTASPTPTSSTTAASAQYFNTAAFTAAPQFVIGTSSRNPVRGPGLQNADLMIGKTFRITERRNLEFRAEVFNVSNTPPLNDPNGSFGSAAFGSITSAGNPR